MGDIFNDDFVDFLRALNQNEVDYVLVGGYSVILHGYSRTTGDMDIVVRATLQNYIKLVNAFRQFGMPVFDMTEEKFLNNIDTDVFTFGRQPVAIDIMTAIKGATFEALFLNAVMIEVDDLPVRTIHINQLIEVKKASGRYKDLDDIEKLSGSR